MSGGSSQKVLSSILDTLRVCHLADDALGQLKVKWESVLAELIKGKMGVEMSEDTAKVELQGSCQLAFRTLVEELVLQKSEDSRNTAAIEPLLLLSIQSAEANYVHATLPFLMLHDLFDSVPIGTCEVIWQMLESHRDALTKPTFVSEKPSRSSLALLRMCNELLRKLSKSLNTEFCGRVLSFLSYVFSITERSAVNLHGKFNVGNSTEFEAEEEFLAAEAADPDLTKSKDGADPMDTSDGEGIRTDNDPPIDYKLYKTIWSLQQYMSEPIKSTKDIASWKIMLANIGNVLTAFEGSAFSEEDLVRARDRRKAATVAQATSPRKEQASTGGQGHFFQPKYLSASRLLRLQRKDPQFRQNVLSQILMMFDFLKSTKPISAKVRPAQDSMLPELEKRIEALLTKTPPNGPEFVKLVTHVLQREENWKTWKAGKCKSFVKTKIEEAKQESAKAKRKRLMSKGLGGSAKRSKANVAQELARVKGEYAKQDNMSVLSDQKYKYTPDLDKFLESMEMAMDPENGIEDEYHPKNDKVYCWRLRRLMAAKSMENFMEFSDGKVEPAVKKYVDKRDGKDADEGAEGSEGSAKPAEETPKPKSETPKPKTPKPKSETPKPESETPKPKSETPKPKSEKAKPKSEKAKPKSEKAKPKSEKAKPKSEKAKA